MENQGAEDIEAILELIGEERLADLPSEELAFEIGEAYIVLAQRRVYEQIIGPITAQSDDWLQWPFRRIAESVVAAVCGVIPPHRWVVPPNVAVQAAEERLRSYQQQSLISLLDATVAMVNCTPYHAPSGID